ncbi:MAG: 5-formyltetrahydrofolate cyclo-ligase [Egibacteraceae bacterium]
MNNTEQAAARKAALRGRMLTERAALSEATRAAASAAIARHLPEVAELAAAETVLAYAAFGHEVALPAYLRSVLRAGRTLCLPWVDGDRLEVGRVTDLDRDLAPGWRGVPEPRAGCRRPVDPAILDAVVVPGLAFDRRGHRLGYGGGHFDRLLAQVGPGTVVVGAAFDVQLVDAVPTETHDAAVDALVTESGIIRVDA